MKPFLSVTEVSQILHISRTAVLKKIKTGSLYAKKIGNTYVIDKDEIALVSNTHPSENQKSVIEKAVKKTMKEYGETLRLFQDS